MKNLETYLLKNHIVVKCKKSRWLKPFIELNSKLRADAKNDFGKDLYKLMNNASFLENTGKCKKTYGV